MIRIHRGFRRAVGYCGAQLLVPAALMLMGLGWHAVVDRHRHGSTGEAYVHLHVHFGAHHHEHGDHERHDDRSPGDRDHSGVLTLAFGVAGPPAVARAEDPVLEPGATIPFGHSPPVERVGIRPAWSPRGPPV